MSSTTLEPSSINKFKVVEASFAVQDADGNLIGCFFPAATPSTVDQFECAVDEEELLRRARQGGGRPLADSLRDLERQS